MGGWDRRTFLTCSVALGGGGLGLAMTSDVQAAPGEQQWAFETGSFVYSSPTVADGTVFVGCTNWTLFAVDTATGEKQWAVETGRRVRSSPTVVADTVFVGSHDNNLYAVDTATGEQQWAFEVGFNVPSSPTVADGTVFIGSEDDNLHAVEAEVAGSSEGSRASLGTLGHHGSRSSGGFQSQTQTTTETTSETTSADGPGFGVISALSALGGAGYLLSQRASESDD